MGGMLFGICAGKTKYSVVTCEAYNVELLFRMRGTNIHTHCSYFRGLAF